MNVKKIIHEELGKNLEEIGFEYFQQQRYFWQYKREKEDVCQYIIIWLMELVISVRLVYILIK